MKAFEHVCIMRKPFRRLMFKQNRKVASSLGMNARLKPDAVPTIDNANEVQRVEEPLSSRQQRKVQNLIYISCGFV